MAGIATAAVLSIGSVFGNRTSAAKKRERTDARLAAFETAVRQDWSRFYRYAYRLCGGHEADTEDLLSESLLDAFQAFDSYRGEGFDRWFFRMITNNRIDRARRDKIRKTESLDTAFADDSGSLFAGREIADPNSDPAKQLLGPLYSESLQRALDNLPEDFRAVILLADVEQMDYQEIADLLKIPVGTVRSRIHRARIHLRKSLEKMGWRNGTNQEI